MQAAIAETPGLEVLEAAVEDLIVGNGQSATGNWEDFSVPRETSPIADCRLPVAGKVLGIRTADGPSSAPGRSC